MSVPARCAERRSGRQAQVDGERAVEGLRLAAGVAHDHGRVDVGVRGDGPDRRGLESARGEVPVGDVEDDRTRAVGASRRRCRRGVLAGFPFHANERRPSSVDFSITPMHSVNRWWPTSVGNCEDLLRRAPHRRSRRGERRGWRRLSGPGDRRPLGQTGRASCQTTTTRHPQARLCASACRREAPSAPSPTPGRHLDAPAPQPRERRSAAAGKDASVNRRLVHQGQGTVRHGAVLAVTCLALATVVSAMASLNVALPGIARETHAGQTQLSWIIDAYSLVFAALLLRHRRSRQRPQRRLPRHPRPGRRPLPHRRCGTLVSRGGQRRGSQDGRHLTDGERP